MFLSMATPGGASTDLINVHTPESVISIDNVMKQRVELKEKLSSLLDSSMLQNSDFAEFFEIKIINAFVHHSNLKILQVWQPLRKH